MPQYETANEQLNMISKRWQKDIDAAQQEAKVLASNYQTEQIFLSQDMKQKREEEILAAEQEVLELKRKYFGQEGEWYKKHVEKERHHLFSKCPDDVDLLDVIEMIVDCVCAGKTRSGEVRPLEISDDILKRAVENTVKLVDKITIVKEKENGTK